MFGHVGERTATVSRLLGPLGDFSSGLPRACDSREGPLRNQRSFFGASGRHLMYPDGCKLCVDPIQGLLQTYRRFLRSTVLSTYFPGMFDV